MDNIQSMLSKMGMGDLGNLAGMAGLAGMGGKLNTGAMEANLNKKMKMAQTKERIRAKAQANAKAKLAQQFLSQQQNHSSNQPTISDEELLKIFSTGEKVERTPRNAKPVQDNNNGNNSNKKKKGKK